MEPAWRVSPSRASAEPAPLPGTEGCVENERGGEALCCVQVITLDFKLLKSSSLHLTPPETPQALYFAALKLQMCSLGSFGSSASPRCACPHRTTTTRRGLSCASAHSENKTADAACGKELSSKGALFGHCSGSTGRKMGSGRAKPPSPGCPKLPAC